MNAYRCPGQSGRNLKVELHRCPGCSYQVEIFSDELRAICPNCGREVHKEKTPSCIDWCKAAEQCLGENAYRELKKEERETKESGKE
ncbi:MAG: phosphohydrolase [Candidatus Aerophobetes bacterium]